MSGLNKVMIIGRLGADPELKTLQGGAQVCKLSVATSENWTDKQGQKQERTEWHRVIVWNKTAELASKYLAKGRQVYIEGKLQTRSWEDQQGQKRYATEIQGHSIQFLGSAPDKNGNQGQGQQQSGGGAPAGFGDFGPEPAFDSSDEIPF
jgi:single-strand DNA-binding protein